MGLEHADAVPAATHHSFSCVAPNGHRAGESFFDGLKSGRRKCCVAPAARMCSPTAERLWLDRSSMTATSPERTSKDVFHMTGERVGQGRRHPSGQGSLTPS